MELNDETTWPRELTDFLKRHHQLFRNWETGHGESVAPQAYDRAIYALREVLDRHDLHGYHCTRLTVREIAHVIAQGMQPPNGEVLVGRIMAAHKDGLFDATVATRLAGSHSADDQYRARRIWFCFFHPRIAGESGIGSLLSRWGGEALYRHHDTDPVIGPILARTGTPCLIEAVVPIASFRPAGGVDFKFVRQFLRNRGLATREPVEHEDCVRTPIPARSIRRVIKHPDPDFVQLTQCDRWRKPLVSPAVRTAGQ
jgi:hypothetical protein